MRLVSRSVALLLPLLLCACGHKADVAKVQPLAPPIEDPPPPKLDTSAAPIPAAKVDFPVPPPPKVVVKPQEPPKKPKSKKPAAKSPAIAPSNSSTQTSQVANDAPPAEVSAIGTLTTNEPDANQKEASDAIADDEKRLGSITRKLDDTEEKTSSQIREYLKQAHTALSSHDAFAAKTLAMKAKVLLDELSQ